METLIEEISGQYKTNKTILKFMRLTTVIVNDKLRNMGVDYSVADSKNELVSSEFMLNYHEELMYYYVYHPTLFTDKLES